MVPKFNKKNILIVTLDNNAESITDQMINEINDPIEYFGDIPAENIPIFKAGKEDLMPKFYGDNVPSDLREQKILSVDIKKICDTFIKNEVRVLILVTFVDSETTEAARIVSNIAKYLGVYTIPLLIHPLYNHYHLEDWGENIDTRASLLVELISDDLLYPAIFGSGTLPDDLKYWGSKLTILSTITNLVKAIPPIEQEDINTEHIIDEVLKIEDKLLRFRKENSNYISNNRMFP